jgi:hypothetical protein
MLPALQLYAGRAGDCGPTPFMSCVR